MDKAFQPQQQGVEDPVRSRQLIRVMPRYVRLRQGSEIRYHIKLSRPPSKGKGVTIHVCVIMNKCGITATPSQLVITPSDWRTPREVVVSSEFDSQLRTIQIHHKIYETYDEVYNSGLVIPSLFVSVLQKEATFLFAFGCGAHGRLGTNSEENALLPASFSCKWMHPVQIACGKAHSAIIDVYSNIYCFGLGTSGQLGQGDTNLDASRIPLRVPSIGAVPVLLVACGSHHTICMTAEGRVFAWGDNSYGQLGIGSKTSKPRGTPTRIDKLGGVRAIVCGGWHSFVVTQDNGVLASGSNIAGQLGLGDRVDRVAFERVPFFRRLLSASTSAAATSALSVSAVSTSNNASDSGFAITDLLLPSEVEVACGLYHSLALCGRQVYAWGNGDDGRLGLGSNESMVEPTLVTTLQDVPIRSIACGGSHSGAITLSGDVFTWGNGQYGQLGVGSVRARRVPTKVRLLHDKCVTQLSFGEWHSMALCNDGSLFAWGFGEEGQLGLPGDEQGFQPELPHSRIALFPTIVHSLSGTGATSVRCGGSHTFVVSVLENRRQHLARLQQQASQSEIRSESRRMRERRQTRVLQGPPTPVGRSATLPIHQVNTITNTMTDEAEQLFQRRPSNMSKRTKAAAKCDSARDNEDHERELERARSFSWRERPLTSRTAVRNALRKEACEFAAVKEMLSELASTSSRPSTPSCSRPTARGSARTHHGSPNTFVSPRLARLQKQVDRATEAGAARLKCAEIIHDEAASSVIRTAVHSATQHCLLAGNDAIHCDIEPERRRKRQPVRGKSSDGRDASFGLNLLLNALTELEGPATSGDGDYSEASAEISLVTSGHTTCLSLEDDIRRRAFA